MKSHAADTLPLRETHISANLEIAPEVYVLKIPRAWDFVPGQVVGVTTDSRIAPRYYSIASGVDEEFVDLLYDIVPTGALTPILKDLVPGDQLFVSEPFGSFRDEAGGTWWIATGTGVAPFVSMAKSGAGDGKRLIHGGRTQERFYYRDYFTRQLGDRYVCCCSQERPAWAFHGRLTEWLRTSGDLSARDRYLLCGSADMVVEVRDILITRGVAYDRIQSEIYF